MVRAGQIPTVNHVTVKNILFKSEIFFFMETWLACSGSLHPVDDDAYQSVDHAEFQEQEPWAKHRDS